MQCWILLKISASNSISADFVSGLCRAIFQTNAKYQIVVMAPLEQDLLGQDQGFDRSVLGIVTKNLVGYW
jgi:hypothetical protein